MVETEKNGGNPLETQKNRDGNSNDIESSLMFFGIGIDGFMVFGGFDQYILWPAAVLGNL